MTRFFSAHARRTALIVVAITAVATVAAWGAAAQGPHPILINESRSLPRGLYLRERAALPRPGSIVAIDQPATIRPYLARLGMPAEVLLIKRVAAAGGDPVCAAGGWLRLKAHDVPVPAMDRRGTTLPRWRGCRSLAADELLLLGDTPGSFDSRYFGPVPRASIRGVYRRILTW